MSAPEIMTTEIDCHAYPWHEADPEYPECGPDNLVRMAEQFGVLVEFLADHDLASWAWWYRITGPRSHIMALLTAEYCGGDEGLAEEMLA